MKRLSRERILDVAADLIEREGVAAVSMRRVGAELGVAAMSLYNHVPSKDALLDGVAERVMSALDFADEPGASWQDRGRTLVRAFRGVARAHPRCVQLALTRQAASPSALRPVEHALAIAEDAGFDGPTAVRIMRALISYAVGTIARETMFQQMIKHLPAELPGQEFRRVRALAGELVADDHDADFEFGLDLLISSITRLQAADK
ncbi:TetR/AcrR family transcriptional regulator C-terminal domain-containing protein [Thermoactinospora rubra]|uniref:TetR/AcrR family transcriptional regulator C-terminal domain-containing protein n=1 Tax=Thermoactinospora rubra TaxID=1088767 RepID=UPI001F0A595D|nr:TetR/AcrR family transcriptional regulator C-terminal domain-containing protein [Thermoactinospora rubra]